MKRVLMEEVTEFVLDGTHGSPVRTESGVPVLSAQNVLDGRLNYLTDRYTSAEEYAAFSRRLPIQTGDLLLTIVGSIGRAAVVKDLRPLVFQRSVAVLRPIKSKIDAQYFYHLTQSQDFQGQLSRGSNKSAQAGVYLGKLKKIALPLPALDEQRRIAAILDQAEALRAKRRAALAKLDTLAQSIFIDMFGDPVTNPKGLKLKSLPEVTKFQEGPGILAKDFRETGVPLVRLSGIDNGAVSLRGCNFVDPELFARKWSQFALNEGDILVLTSATFGKPAVVGKAAVGAIFYTGIIRFLPMQIDIEPIYLRQFLASPWFLRQAVSLASGAVIKHFGPTHLRQMTIPVPPVYLQQQFARRVVKVESLREPLEVALLKSESLFSSIQHRAFRGEL